MEEMSHKPFLLLFGPNLNQIEKRDAKLYGALSLAEIARRTQEHFQGQGVEVVLKSSNCEGELIDILQEFSEKAAGIIFNPGALSHYSYALHDAILDVQCPVVEVHFSNIHAREDFRRTSVTAPACDGVVAGFGWAGVITAIASLRLRGAE